MSLLVDLLEKVKRKKSVKSVSPVLEQVSRKRKGRRWIYILIVFGALLSVASGFIVVGLFKGKTSIPEKRMVVQMHPRVKKSIYPLSEKKTERGVAIGPQKVITREMQKPLPHKKVAESEKKGKTDNRPIDNKNRNGKLTKNTKTVSNQRDTVGKTTSIDYYIYQAISSEKSGHYMDAIIQYKRALEFNKKDVRILNKLSYLYIKIKSPDEAIAFAKKALELKPGYVDAAINLSVALMIKGKIDRATETLISVYKNRPDDRRIIYNLALMYERKGDLDSATKLYKELYYMNDIKGMLGLARIQEKKGNFRKALQYYREALNQKDLNKTQKLKIEKRLSILSRVAD